MQIGKCLLKPEDINVILNIKSDNVDTFIKLSENLAKEFKNISTSKLRDFYDYVLRIDENNKDWYKELVLLKPKMAYNYGKETNRLKREALGNLCVTFSTLIDEINNNVDKFKNFKTFFEAVVAYHKIYAKS